MMQFDQLKRRDFITLVGVAAVWPLAARAQQASRIRRIGVLLPATADDPEFQARVGAFLQELQQLGWSIGRNVRIDTHWATANPDDIRKHAADLARLAPDVILAHGTSTVRPLMQAPVAAAVAGLDKKAQAKITADVRDALAAYRVGDSLAAPIEAHVAIGHR